MLAWLRLSLVDHGEIISERPETRLELLLIKTSTLVFVEVLEHHTEIYILM